MQLGPEPSNKTKTEVWRSGASVAQPKKRESVAVWHAYADQQCLATSVVPATGSDNVEAMVRVRKGSRGY